MPLTISSSEHSSCYYNTPYKMTAVCVQPPNPVGPLGQPDIAYAPDYTKYLARGERRMKDESLQKTLPAGFPQKLNSELVWEGKDIGKQFDWDYHLTKEDLLEIDNALKHFKASGLHLGLIDQQTFPLAKLHKTMRAISREVHHGHGFKVVRGIPVDDYSREDNVIIYAGLSSHVASIRGRQDSTWLGKPADVVMAHVKDLSNMGSSNVGSPAYTAEKQVFHTDTGDVIALFALCEAESGGESFLSSSWHVYNELAASRPDLIRTLSEPWEFDEFGRNGKTSTSRPLLYYQAAKAESPERMIIQYARRYFTGYWGLPRTNSIGPITEAQAEALDALHFLAEKHAVSVDFHKGDIQFANNLSIFHARGSFKNLGEKQRHLIRLWLRDEENAWETPAQLQPLWDRVYKDLKAENSVFPLDATMRETDNVGSSTT
ncbi:Clavaminate synthase-like protein [Macroventuria anomochaeta]|uniref:Clavaminate synthase-like protein n=1 Tax=Macroventuria anomochaeta TaxID=301207 RepID=A0ACB6SH42_9PLEO|nr:Clavaminate synthase-like protein [Macroventuria anomochaeta]KAF2633272.1 Clavaminate synthase-like protein [Macroventuria anomochaeta]